MPTCCKGKGRKPRLTTVGKDENGRFHGFVGSVMFSGYETELELRLDALVEIEAQRVLPCGHVLRPGE